MTSERMEILAIGDEILDGRVVDTNSLRLAQAIAPVGLQVSQRTAVTDDIEAIAREAKAIAARGTKVCVVSGGLGPTSDDVTAQAFAHAAHVPLVRDADAAHTIEAYLARRNRPVTTNHLRQADRPQGARAIANARGTAPGFIFTLDGCDFYALPGVPHEFDAMVQQALVAPRLATAVPQQVRALYVFGLIEADVDHRLADLRAQWPDVRLQYRVYFPEVHVTLRTGMEHVDKLEEAFAFAKAKLEPFTFATEAQPFAASVLKLLLDRKERVATAESCTGGLITDMLTDLPGSSEAVHVGITAYSNLAKHKLLGVTQDALDKFGAVSEAVVLQMAQGARQILGSTYGLAVSGIAGPGGGTADKPVGTVWFALAWEGGEQATHLLLPWERRNNKVVSAYTSLELLRRHLLDKEAGHTG
jgi:nicotinamide-nucleotide amidase